ncbi:MAG: hypothetical protein HY692_03230 [Cyanobacteria bacterium NC_groundwater_1444_Ag_S-0.65um_54_12]|nr:hypothetical protein [Cyanobacteria bacterium NC_groundwater_1444_Ag_S-0.65um_54_12]
MMRYRLISSLLCSVTLLAGCGIADRSSVRLPELNTMSAQVKLSAHDAKEVARRALKHYFYLHNERQEASDGEKDAIGLRILASNGAGLRDIRALALQYPGPDSSEVLDISITALEQYDLLMQRYRTLHEPSAKRQLIAQLEYLTARALQRIANLTQGSKWEDPDQALKKRLDLLRREYENGTFNWKEYNEARVNAILHAHGANVDLRLRSMEDIFEEGGIVWNDYNRYRVEIVSQAYNAPVTQRLELLGKIYRDGGMSWVSYNQTRVRIIVNAHGESVDTRLKLLEQVFEDGGISWPEYNQARVDLIRQAYGSGLQHRLDLLGQVFQEGGINWQVYNQTRVEMIMYTRSEPLELRLQLLERVYQEGGISYADYQRYRKELISQG